MPRKAKTVSTPGGLPSSALDSNSRRTITHPPTVWLERLKSELVACGIAHDQAGLISRRVLSSLIPQNSKLEALDIGGPRQAMTNWSNQTKAVNEMVSSRSKTNAKPAQTEREWRDLMRNSSAKVVRSGEDWQRVLKSARSPLKGCKESTVRRFTKSLVFRGGGLAGAYYGGVAMELSYSGFLGLWGMFGLGGLFFEDHKDMRCASKGTCEPYTGYVCTSNC